MIASKWLSRKTKITLIVGALLVIAAGFVVLGKNESEMELVAVTRQDLTRVISLTGTVRADQSANLGFEDSGQLVALNVDSGDRVVAGQVLARLDIAKLTADLAAAEANVQLKRANISNITVNIDRVRAQQNALVAGAYRTLLSSGLVAEPQNDSYTQTPPLITGSYSGPEGSYKIRVDISNRLTDYQLYTFGLENAGAVDINETGPTAMGTRGLYVSFPDGYQNYRDTTWYIDIPNVSSDEYLANSNAYEQALRTRELEVTAAEEKLAAEQGSASVATAELAQAEAEVNQIKTGISNRILLAPFSGVVTKAEAEIGEIVTAGTNIVSLIDLGSLKLRADVPEVNIAEIKLGNTAEVTLDAYGDAETFTARVTAINPAETIVDGITTYEVTFRFEKPDARIRSGLTANIEVATAERPGALALPRRAVLRSGGKNTVQILDGETIITKKIALGVEAVGGLVEVVAGLAEGDQVVISPSVD